MKKLLFLIALLVVSVQVVQAQTITISGTVKDADTEEAVIGASIVVKGTTTGTITDLDGNFSLAVSEGATIVVSSIGYNDYEFVASSTATTLAIVLKASTEFLDDVVVVGYGCGPKKMEKVKEYGIRIMKEDELMQYLK